MKELPDFETLIFKANEHRTGIFDLIDNNEFDKFKFFRLEKPRTNRLQSIGVVHVIESWDNGKKILHSGLIPIHDNFFVGDFVNLITPSKPSLMLIKIIDNQEICIWFFNSYSKYSHSLKIKFCLDFINEMSIC